IFLVGLSAFALGQNTQSPKREFRGVWIATLKNIDWPPHKDMHSEEQMAEIVSMLDMHQANGINAVIFQVRPAADAFYDSPFEPWSEWLTGKQGKAPDPYYDPLAFFIDECHKRGMAFHAWFNPYRAVVDANEFKQLDPNHISLRKPDWFVKYGPNLYFDPGIPEGRDYVIQIIKDVATRYDIDAVHFDDYFYPYPINGQDFPDSLSYSYFGRDFPDKAEWRRNNVNTFIHRMRDTLLASRPDLIFGISPFGVWRNQDRDPEGSATRAGAPSYDVLYADIRSWLKKGWIDYVAPQIYWSIGYPPASYDVLVKWWNNNAYGKHVYIGHALYKVANNQDLNWDNPSEIPDQIRMTRKYPNIQGSIFFSSKWFADNTFGVTDSINRNLYPHPALLPSMNWVDNSAPPFPALMQVNSTKEGIQLTWDPPGDDSEAWYYGVYRLKGSKIPEPNPESLVKVVQARNGTFTDPDTRFLRKYTYMLTAMDRMQNESSPGVYRSQRRWSLRRKAVGF
ncbi:MAG: family 10 glycosylhydrolase, partial [Bacteroidetes bacterium]|nr:family 10 glycosylhydrolase [Bacteroidota bacterium]